MAYHPRRLGSTLKRALRTFPAALVTGPRQSGKTTFVRQEFGQSHRYVSLERPEVRARAIEDPVGFFEDNPPPIILDEVQYVPQLLHHIKELIDERRRPGQWLLTGSQSFGLMQGVSQSLAGRVAVFQLDPFSLLELSGLREERLEVVLKRVFEPTPGSKRRTRSAKRRADLGDWLLRGGFPEVRLHPRVDRDVWFSSYVATYLERDVRSLTQVGDLEAFGRFVQLVATRNGGLLNRTELGRDAGVTGPTVKHWLSVLQASQLVYLLRPYHRSFGKRSTKSPKLYITDPGLATYLLGLHSTDAILQGPSLGALAESVVLAEWLKMFRTRGLQAPIYFWRSSKGHEVDLLVDFGGQLLAIEVKATATPTSRHAEHLSRWLELAGPRARGVLACRIDEPVRLGHGLRAVPWHLAW